jgi:hypothetical protein
MGEYVIFLEAEYYMAAVQVRLEKLCSGVWSECWGHCAYSLPHGMEWLHEDLF